MAEHIGETLFIVGCVMIGNALTLIVWWATNKIFGYGSGD